MRSSSCACLCWGTWCACASARADMRGSRPPAGSSAGVYTQHVWHKHACSSICCSGKGATRQLSSCTPAAGVGRPPCCCSICLSKRACVCMPALSPACAASVQGGPAWEQAQACTRGCVLITGEAGTLQRQSLRPVRCPSVCRQLFCTGHQLRPCTHVSHTADPSFCSGDASLHALALPQAHTLHCVLTRMLSCTGACVHTDSQTHTYKCTHTCTHTVKSRIHQMRDSLTHTLSHTHSHPCTPRHAHT